MNRNLFDFAPSAWLPTQDKAVLEYCRNIRREEMETTNENGYSIKVVPHPSSAVACELFNWIYRSDVEDKKTVFKALQEKYNLTKSYIYNLYEKNKD